MNGGAEAAICIMATQGYTTEAPKSPADNSEAPKTLADDSEAMYREIVVEGTVSGENAAIAIHQPYEGCETIPVLVVGGLESGSDSLITSSYLSDEQIDELLTESVLYIIKAKNLKVDGADTYTTKKGKEYDVAKEKQVITLTPKVKKGYRLTKIDFGKYSADVTDNGDGTYTITVERGGKLYFKAYTEAIPQKKTTKKAPSVGSKVSLSSSDWIITEITESGEYVLASVKEFTDEEMADPQALLAELLSEAELACVKTDACAPIDQAAADTYFEGNMNHISITADPAILKAGK